MRELRPANELLDAPERLRERFEADGYLLLRDVVDAVIIHRAKSSVMAWFAAQGSIEIRNDEPMWLGTDLAGLGAWPPGLAETRIWEWLSQQETLHDIYELVFGEPGVVLPIGQYQFTWPGENPFGGIGLHQDGPYNPGLRFATFWIPLMTIGEKLGGLTLVPESHRDGSLLPDLHTGTDESNFIAQARFGPEEWARTEYRAGDVLVFDRFTVHRGLANFDDRLRLSIDYRVRPQSAQAPIEGVVVGVDGDTVTISSDTGREERLAVTDRTLLRGPNFSLERTPSEYLGQRVIAIHDGGLALAFRIPDGSVPMFAAR